MNDSALLRYVLAWGIPLVVVAAVLGYETDWGRDVAHDAMAPAAPPPPPVAVALLPEYRIADGVEARKETVDRVLFNPTRRPAPPSTQTAGAASSMQRGLYTLTGTTVVGNVATAFLREVKGGKARTVHKGDKLDGMTIAEVTADSVRLTQGNDVEDLRLKIASGPKTTVQTAVAPVPAVPGQPMPVPPQVARPGVPQAGGSNGVAAPEPARPVAPPPAQRPAGAQRSSGTISVGELLAERRRAARAAAEAAQTPSQTPRQ